MPIPQSVQTNAVKVNQGSLLCCNKPISKTSDPPGNKVAAKKAPENITHNSDKIYPYDLNMFLFNSYHYELSNHLVNIYYYINIGIYNYKLYQISVVCL